jgi:hypothetical protein
MVLMSRFTACTLLASASLLAPLPARAEVELEPGLWQEVETSIENDQPAKVETTSRCMTAEEASQPSKGVVFDEELRKHCKALEFKRTGDNLTFRLQCGTDGFEVNLDATFTFHTPQHYSGNMKSSIKLGPIMLRSDKTIDAKRIGECKN